MANWVVAIVCWIVSAFLGIAAPTGIFVYTILFVVGLVAAIVAIAGYVLSRFGTEPEADKPAAPAAADEPAAAAGA